MFYYPTPQERLHKTHIPVKIDRMDLLDLSEKIDRYAKRIKRNG